MENTNNFKDSALAKYKVCESFLSSLKFAVIIISVFAIALIYGTFMESYHGRDFASRIVYKSWWFMLIQGFMFLSILLATLVRLPPKKRLYGFYVIHTGLITLFAGSFVTYKTGVDGIIELVPSKPTSTVLIDEDHFEILRTSDGKSFDVKLPYLPFETNINGNLSELKLKLVKYLPSAEYKTRWIDEKNAESGHYQIFNNNVSQDVTLSLSKNSDYRSIEKMGPLSLHLMPKTLFKCFMKDGPSGHVILNVTEDTCFTPKEKNIAVKKSEKGTDYFILTHQGKELKFFPDFSPFPVKKDLTKDLTTPFRVMSKNLFKESPHLFIFGKQVAFYNKRKGWQSADLSGKVATLPWMGFKFRLIKYSESSYPEKFPVYTKPLQDGGEIVQGGLSAVLIKISGQQYWVTTEAPVALSKGREQLKMRIIKKSLKLPYQMTLEKFKMDTNPGTNTPASYESYVSVLDGRKNSPAKTHHIFMNNPLKYDGFTFYQSSYFPIGPDQFGSALSVNFDPGRWIKYLGSLLIVFGSIWHYLIMANLRKSRKSVKTTTPKQVIGEPNV